jgi:glycosyltransferase involved in cell wall biosynthesis
MKVSINIPTYNQEEYIERAIKSAMNQSFQPVEINILDDSSNDNTFGVAKLFESENINVFKNENNIGRVKTYRKLLYDISTGDWAINLDGDDYFTDNDFISHGMSLLKEHKKAVFYQATATAQSNSHHFTFKHKLLGKKLLSCLDGKFYFKNFFKNECFGHFSTIYNAKLARRVGFYEFDSLQADAESILKLSLQGDVILENRNVGIWSIHDKNESKKYFDEEEINKGKKYINRVAKYSEETIGKEDAENWRKSVLQYDENQRLYHLAHDDFGSFVKQTLKRKQISLMHLKLFAKKILLKI